MTRKRIAVSILRISLTVSFIIGLSGAAYFCWQPGSREPLPEFSDNAIWLGHGWLGDDDWFLRYKRHQEDFRSEKKMAALFQKLRRNHISIVFPHLCPAQYDGRIAPCDDVQVERFLDFAEACRVRVIPWVGGVWGSSARVEDEAWRRNFIGSIAALLQKHPRLSGIQLNVEPLPDGDLDFLRLLEELRSVMTDRILSVAAYPPPTKWQNNDRIHWQLWYLIMVADRCDQMAVMMYDTAVPLEKFYVSLMTRWTRLLTGCVYQKNCRLLLGVPAYQDADSGYHHPRVENLSSALRGIAAAPDIGRVNGLAIYCEWEMDDAKWRVWRDLTVRPGSGTTSGSHSQTSVTRPK